MIIKKIIFVAVLLIATSIVAQRKPDHEKIKALKIAYLTEKLDLTTNEAQKFWPVYNAHEEKVEKIRMQQRSEIHEKIREIDKLSEKELNKLLELEISLNEKKHALEEKFILDVRKVVSAKKTFIMLQSEYGFKRKLLHQYRKKHKSENK
ncbi:hypothetical protein CLV91_2211 [Maribacter vaceletii]|uniref:LTXXQ motif family protein n=1 Tax=Maribacter vaceletii TaxID=1206816 RepID=A0A495E9Y4_9FLAO|nr:hypothetical protein [Maribacter vaceletii]RKR13491.1 hypothetical protein CLV91_2211 [Maribacter vaceletii]